MNPEYSVGFDRARGMLRLTLSGFFDLPTVEQFAAERDAAVCALALPLNQHVTLCDIREQKISPAPVSAAFQKMISDPRFASRKLAIVVASGVLEQMQTKRNTGVRSNVGYFHDVAEAEAWLMQDSASVESA